MKPSTSGYCCPLGFVVSGSTKTHARVLSDAAYNIDYSIFRNAVVNSLPTFGLSIYDSTGVNIFHTNDKHLRLIAVHSYTRPTLYTSTVDVTVNDADNNYFLIQNNGFYYNTDGIFINRYIGAFTKINSTTVRIKPIILFKTATVNSGQFGSQYQGSSFLLEFNFS